ncbi:glycosyltransferase [Terribacillus sp. DMT04]|uniref:glycosyltransferase n=1 Tax=Terribacillus sp. DMT04 TaxID=2850441 RepID=UPI001C2BEA78|nr:glycosyltransferase [Terribacillus sp. DMT04]QXE01063.1 glycosyltransferase [Terribacillus sp. DMT04]
MKICIVNEGFKLGGVERVATILANALAEENNEISIVDFSGINEFNYEIDNKVNVNKVIHKRSLMRKFKTKIHKAINLNSNLKAYTIYKEQTDDLVQYLMENSFDRLILCQGNLTALIPHIKSRLPSISIIAWQHNEFDIYLNNYYNHIREDFERGLMQADTVVCLTKKDKDKFKKYNDNTHYIYNPLTLSPTKRSSLTQENILFAGRLAMNQKGIDYLLDIAGGLKPGWRVLIAGDGLDRNKINNLIIKRNLTKKVLLLGSLKDKQLEDFFLSGSVFISTSRWEGFGLVITEAMSYGLPVISFENRGPDEILNAGEHGIIIEKNNIKIFTEELNKLMNDAEKRKLFSDLSYKRSQDFKLDSILKSWISVISTEVKIR